MRASCTSVPLRAPVAAGSCGAGGSSHCGTVGTAATLADLVHEYINGDLSEKLRERLAWRALPFDIALARAAYGRDASGVKHAHQWRLRDQALSEARTRAIAQRDAFSDATDFEALLRLAGDIRGEVFGLGAMWRYDFAERIGAHLNIGPTHTVYVQRGALVGARRLNLRVRAGRLVHDELPDALRALDAADVEDFLCIKKSVLNTGMLVSKL